MVLYGASGHCKVIIDILEANNIPIDYIIDDNPTITSLFGYNVRNNIGEYDKLIISIGDNKIREQIADLVSVNEFSTVIHPSAMVSPRATIGAGCVVMQGAIVQSCTNIGKHCIINTGASIDHDCQIGNFVHISPHATLCGNVQVGDGCWIGAGATIVPGVKIGKWASIGAGAAVIRNVPDNTVVAGVPAKIIKYK